MQICKQVKTEAALSRYEFCCVSLDRHSVRLDTGITKSIFPAVDVTLLPGESSVVNKMISQS